MKVQFLTASLLGQPLSDMIRVAACHASDRGFELRYMSDSKAFSPWNYFVTAHCLWCLEWANRIPVYWVNEVHSRQTFGCRNGIPFIWQHCLATAHALYRHA